MKFRHFSISLIAAVSMVTAAHAQDFAGQTLRVATFGGSWQEWVQANVEPVFTAKTGASVEYVAGFPQRHLATLVASRGQTPPFDVVELSDDVTIEALAQGLLQTGLDMSLIPNAEKLPENWQNMDDAGPAYFSVLQGVIYDTAAFEQAGLAAPDSWDDLADPTLAGHVAIPDVAFTYRPIYAAINEINSGDQANLQGSLNWIASLTDPIIYADAPTLQTRFDGGQIWAVVGGAGYLLRLQASNPNLRFVMIGTPEKPAGIGAIGQLRVVANSEQAELAHYWIDAFLDTDVQTSLTKNIGFAAVNQEAVANLAADPALADLVVSDPSEIDQLYSADWSQLNPVLPQWLDLWNRNVRR